MQRSPTTVGCCFWHAALLALASSPATSQCANAWVPGGGHPGVEGHVLASTMWDPDGAGPALPLLVLGGSFRAAGTQACNFIATYEPMTGTWSTLGAGTNNVIYSLATLANGDLVVGGDFTLAGGVAASHVARWNGTAWSAIGSGVDDTVRSITELPNGEIVIGGDFFAAGSVIANCVARWDGNNWHGFGSGMAWASPTGPSVEALAVLPSGQLIAGGWFTHADGVQTVGIARWNGPQATPQWSSLAGSVNSGVTALHVIANGDLIVGGHFGVSGGITTRGIARWNGTNWAAIGSGMQSPGTIGQIEAITSTSNGDIFAAGRFQTAGGVPARAIARWDGSTWSALGFGLWSSAYTPAETLTTLPDGDVVCGGRFIMAGDLPVKQLARWDGSTWSALGTGMNWRVSALVSLPNGNVIAGGEFSSVNSVRALYVASFDGTQWTPLGLGMDNHVHSLVAMPNGDVIAGGRFETADGNPANGIAQWDGTSWSPLGAGVNGSVAALAVAANGDLIVAGDFSQAGGIAATNIARWDGSNWFAMGNGLGIPLGYSWARVSALHVRPNGDIIAGGLFAPSGGANVAIARWNGSNWQTVGGGIDGYVWALTTSADGDLIASGSFLQAGGTPANRIARWDGSSWNALGAGLGDAAANALVMLPDGDLVVGGSFETAGGIAANRLARWDGNTWSSMLADANFSIDTLALRANGALLVGGSFDSIGGNVSPYFAQLVSTCPATSVDLGGGCAGSGGINELTTEALPWIGSTFHARGTGMPALSLVSVVTGFTQTNLPLSAVLPQGQPGCDLLVTPDYVVFEVANAGAVTTSLAIPTTPALAGITFYQQLNPFELDGAWNIVAVTASNALRLQVGVF